MSSLVPESLSPSLESFWQKTQSDTSAAPAWWQKRKAAEWEKFQSLPMPRRTDEDWRFARINSLNFDGYTEPQPIDEEGKRLLEERSLLPTEVAGVLIFINDRLVSFQAVDPKLAEKGVVWKPLSQAVEEDSDLLEKHFMSQPIELGSEKFSALHGALCKEGSLLHVPKGVEIDKPFVAYHWASGENASIFPHTLLIADEMAKVTLVDYFASADPNSRNLAIGVNDLYAGKGAKVTYLSAQNWSLNSLAFHLNSTQAFRDAFITSLNLHLGGSLARTESHSQILGENAHTEMLSLTVANGEQQFDQRTLQTHYKGHSVSDLLYKNALFDNGRTIFSGLIRVLEDAQKTDAYQTNRNLLLDPTAEANALPGLEILANDVKCSHGATTGQIDEEQLYYLLARGIPRKEAYKLLTYGFFEEVLEKLENSEIQEHFRDLIKSKFQTS
ncbi:MAG: Fe-S cluster assembly protein SufD [Opitutales bacterium]|nr:Fe-S cluster assembly protein SufD [Opitutales bacterium]MCH8540415.1 Fe-S cluster assembly protein SufD [Opitutales bacterium]